MYRLGSTRYQLGSNQIQSSHTRSHQHTSRSYVFPKQFPTMFQLGPKKIQLGASSSKGCSIKFPTMWKVCPNISNQFHTTTKAAINYVLTSSQLVPNQIATSFHQNTNFFSTRHQICPKFLLCNFFVFHGDIIHGGEEVGGQQNISSDRAIISNYFIFFPLMG